MKFCSSIVVLYCRTRVHFNCACVLWKHAMQMTGMSLEVKVSAVRVFGIWEHRTCQWQEFAVRASISHHMLHAACYFLSIDQADQFMPLCYLYIFVYFLVFLVHFWSFQQSPYCILYVWHHVRLLSRFNRS